MGVKEETLLDCCEGEKSSCDDHTDVCLTWGQLPDASLVPLPLPGRRDKQGLGPQCHLGVRPSVQSLSWRRDSPHKCYRRLQSWTRPMATSAELQLCTSSESKAPPALRGQRDEVRLDQGLARWGGLERGSQEKGVYDVHKHRSVARRVMVNKSACDTAGVRQWVGRRRGVEEGLW